MPQQGIQIWIEDKTKRLEYLVNRLSDKNINTANVRAINRAIRKVTTEYRRQIRDKYNVTYAETKPMVSPKNANTSKIEGTISGSKQPISLSRFRPEFVSAGTLFSIRSVKNKETGKRGLERRSQSATKKNTGQIGVNFEIKKGEKVNLPFAFMTASDKNKGVEKQIFARGRYDGNQLALSKARYPIQALKSVAPFGMMTTAETSAAIEKSAADEMRKEFERQINLLVEKTNRQ